MVLKAASGSRYLPCYHTKDNLAAWDGTYTQESYPCFTLDTEGCNICTSAPVFSIALLGQIVGRRSSLRLPCSIGEIGHTGYNLPILQCALYALASSLFFFKINNPFRAAALILIAFKHQNASEDPDQGELTASIPY